MNLVVVESPTKSKTLSSFLGRQYLVLATMGHVRDLPENRLGIKFKPDTASFELEYVLLPKKKEAVNKLKSEAKKAQKIYLATDPDREGEAIAWHVTQLLPKSKNYQRIIFHEITKSAIEKALSSPGEINLQLVNAQQARRVLDRLVGYKLSPLLWYKIRKGLSAGRVQSVALRLIVDREKEIEKFVAVEFWEIWVQLRRHIGGLKEGVPTFLAQLVKINGQAAEIKNETQSNQVTAELEHALFEVAGVEKKEVQQRPSPPFTTSTLQQKAALTLRFSSKKTMRTAQKLYERGLITYHRTDSLNLSSEAIQSLRLYINKVYGSQYLPAEARFYKTRSKIAQEAHEAIRPTNIEAEPSFADHDEERLYELIWKRAVACQMSPALWDQTKIAVSASAQTNLYLLQAEGKVIKFDGWLKVYGGAKVAQDVLPELEKGIDLDLIKIDPQQKFTQPPPRYNEASLIKALEERGIGRPSTYAPIVSVIQDRQYVEKAEGKFRPTSLGLAVTEFLVEYFPEIVDYEFTAKMEEELDDIARGSRTWPPVVADFYVPFEKKLSGVKAVAERVKVPAEATGEKCPTCQKGSVVIRLGRFGKFLSCSRFPDCKYTAPFIPKLEGVKCPKCKGDVVIKTTKQKRRRFYGCSNWPGCDWASWRKPK
jgi:DNA topoisomerase-1